MPAGTEEIMKLLDQIISRYRPGGEFGRPEEALLGRAKTKSLAKTAQGLVSAGLAGTTAGAGAGRLWEEEVGMPARLRLEDIRSQRLTEAMGAKAGYLERRETRTAAGQEAARQRAATAAASRPAFGTALQQATERFLGGGAGDTGDVQPTTGDVQPTTGDRGYPSPYGAGAGAGEAIGPITGPGPREIYGPITGMYEPGIPSSTAEAVGQIGGVQDQGAQAWIARHPNWQQMWPQLSKILSQGRAPSWG